MGDVGEKILQGLEGPDGGELAEALGIEATQTEEADDGEPAPLETAEQILEAVRSAPLDVFKQPVLGALAALPASEYGRLKALVKSRYKGAVNLLDLNQAVREEQRLQRRHLREASDDEAAAPSLQELLDGCPVDAPLPPGWRITVDGVYELVTRQGERGLFQHAAKRFPVPVVLSAVQEPLDAADQGLSYEVSWQNGSGEWRRSAYPAEAIFDRAKLVGAAAAGLPVDSENAKGLLRWLAALRDTRAIPSKKVVTRCGWHGHKTFVLGTQVLNKYTSGVNKTAQDAAQDYEVDTSSADAVDAVDSGTDNRVDWTTAVRASERELVSAFRVLGDAQTQRQLLVDTVKRYPLAGFLVGASAAAPLLRLLHGRGHLEIHGFVVEVTSDQAGVGKTTGQELAASVFGSPGHLLRTFDRTSVAWEALLYTLCDCPVYLEETQLGTKEDQATKLVYALALGMGRERGTRSGGLRVTKQFFNTVLLASERSLKTFASREGIEARVLSLPPVFGPKDPDRGKELRRLRALYYQHHGHAGQAYIKDLVTRIQAKQWQNIVRLFEQSYETLAQAVPVAADGETRSAAMRLATRVATCWTGLQFLLQAVDVPEAEAYEIAITSSLAAWDRIMTDIDAIPLWRKALGVLQSFVAENVHRIAGMESMDTGGRVKIPSNGYIGGLVMIKNQPAIGFFPNVFNEVIKKFIGEGAAIRDGLAREKVILRDGEGRYTRNERIRPRGGDSYTTRVICIPEEILFPKAENDQDTGGTVRRTEWSDAPKSEDDVLW